MMIWSQSLEKHRFGGDSIEQASDIREEALDITTCIYTSCSKISYTSDSRLSNLSLTTFPKQPRSLTLATP